MKKAEVNEDFSLIYLFNKLPAVADIYAFPQLARSWLLTHQLTAYGVDGAIATYFCKPQKILKCAEFELLLCLKVDVSFDGDLNCDGLSQFYFEQPTGFGV